MNEEGKGITEEGKFPAGIPVYDYWRFKDAPSVVLTVEVTPKVDSTPEEVKELSLKELKKTGLPLSILEDLPDDLPLVTEE